MGAWILGGWGTPRVAGTRGRGQRSRPSMDTSWARRVEAAGSDPGALHVVVLEAIRAGAAREVVAAADRLLALDPAAMPAVVARAEIEVELGEASRAVARLEAFVAAHPDAAEAWLALGKATAALDGGRDVARARALALRALELDRELEAAIYWLATLEARAHGPAAYARTLGELAARGSLRAARALGAFAWREGDRPGARTAFARAVRGGAVGGVLEDLARLGADEELLRVGDAHYDPAAHGVAGGLALVAARARAGRLDDARALLEAIDAAASPLDRPRIAEAGALLAAAAPEPAAGAVVESVSWTGTLAGAIAGEPSDRGRAPRWVWMAWADLSSAPREAGHAEAASSRWARALPLALAERLREAYAVECVSVVPVLGDAGLFRATEAWELPALMALVPTDAPWLVEGALTARTGAGLKARVRVWSLERRRLHKTLTATGADVVELAAQVETKLRALLDLTRTAKTRGARPSPLRASYLEALAEVEVEYLLASGALAPSAAWNAGAAVEVVQRAVAEAPDDAGVRRLEAALVRCREARGLRA